MTEEERRRMAASPAVPRFPEGQPTASVRDWSQNPAVAAAMRTGSVADVEKATMAARDAFRAGGVWAQGAREVPLNPTPALQQRTPEEQQMLLAQMAERGAAIGQRLEQESRQRGYAFRQGIAERKAQEALTPSFGGYVGREATMRGAQAMIEAERLKQVQAGRSPTSREPLTVGGLQFRQTSMGGQFAPIRGFGNDWASSFISGGPQPAQAATSTITPPTVQQQLPPVIPDRSLGLSAESPLAFTPFGRRTGESPMRTPAIPPITRSPFPRNVASSMTSPLGVPRFPYLGA
jgi:hypothetical protein